MRSGNIFPMANDRYIVGLDINGLRRFEGKPTIRRLDYAASGGRQARQRRSQSLAAERKRHAVEDADVKQLRFIEQRPVELITYPSAGSRRAARRQCGDGRQIEDQAFYGDLTQRLQTRNLRSGECLPAQRVARKDGLLSIVLQNG
jgi:hypothetical protein